MQKKFTLDISIVVPMFNEEESIVKVLKEIREVMNDYKKISFEVIVIDDGSTDGSVIKVQEFSKTFRPLKLIKLRRNFGQTAAMAAGIDYSSGKTIVTLDADGQNDPNDIPKLLNKISEGFSCVSGRRVKRQDKLLSRKVPSAIANWVIRKLTKLEINDFGCTLKAYEGNLLRSIPLYGDMHRFLPFYISLAGGKVTQINVNHRSRQFGTSKYGISRTFRVINDVLVARVQSSFFTRPMHLFGNLGFLLLVISFTTLLIAFYMKLLGMKDFIESPLLLLSGVCALSGLQLIFTGFLAEIILRRFSFASNDQVYVIKENSAVH